MNGLPRRDTYDPNLVSRNLSPDIEYDHIFWDRSGKKVVGGRVQAQMAHQKVSMSGLDLPFGNGFYHRSGQMP